MNKTKILYIDSDKHYSKKLLHFLIDNHYNVKYIEGIKEAFIEYSFNKCDIVLIDTHLKDGSGLEFIKEIKNQNSQEGIIVLTQSVDQALFSQMIPLKVDRLLFKENSFYGIKKEIDLLSPIETPIQEETLLFNLGNTYFYDKIQKRIIKDSHIIWLTPQEDSLVYELIKAQGGFVAFERLQNAISKNETASIDTLRTVVRKIRKKSYTGIIENQSGLGYRINVQGDIDVYTKFDMDEILKLNLNLLILMGNKYKADSLNYQLERLGFNCESLYTIEDAKMAMAHGSFDYIVSELNLPDGDGADFIKSIHDLNATKVIVLSNNSDIHYKEYLYFRGVIDFIVDIDNLPYQAYTIYKTILKVQSNTEFNKILVIEKSKKIGEQIKDILKPRNYQVNLVNDLIQAYELLKREKYALVILDISYKESFRFLTDVKSTLDKSIPFIVLTDTNRSYNVVRDSFKNGASDALRKPIFAEEFILKVDQLVEYYKTIQELTRQTQLLESYKNIVDISVIVSKTNPKGIITYVNSMFCKLSQYANEELIGKPHNIVRHPDVPKETFQDMWERIQNKQVWSGVVKNRAKDGSTYIVKTSIMPIINSDGEIEEYISLRSDITALYQEQQSWSTTP